MTTEGLRGEIVRWMGRGGGGGGMGLAKRSLPGPSPGRRNHPATDFPEGTDRQDWQIVPPRIPA